MSAIRLRQLDGALGVPNFRRYVSGQALSLIGTWVETVAQGLLVLRLARRCHDAAGDFPDTVGGCRRFGSGRRGHHPVPHHRQLNRSAVLDPHYRGRVMALWSTALVGSTPIGAPIAGAVSQAVNPRAAILLGALACAGAAAISWTGRHKSSGRPAAVNPSGEAVR